MWRDLWAFVRALRKHFFGLAGGTFVGAVMLLWDDVLHWGEIPSWAWVVAAVLGLFISGFNAWREEHGKVAASPEAIDPEASRRPEFERQIAKLNPDQQTVLRYVINVGDTSAQQLRDRFFHEQQNKSVSAHDADLLMLGIAETTGLLEPKDKGTAFPRYGVKAVWANLLTEWTAPPTVVDKRIADKARALRRTLAASFEGWPASTSSTILPRGQPNYSAASPRRRGCSPRSSSAGPTPRAGSSERWGRRATPTTQRPTSSTGCSRKAGCLSTSTIERRSERRFGRP